MVDVGVDEVVVDLEEVVVAEEGIEVVEEDLEVGRILIIAFGILLVTMISGFFVKFTFFLQNLFYPKKQYLKSQLPK